MKFFAIPVLLAAALVPLANLLIPEDSVFHVPGYLVPLWFVGVYGVLICLVPLTATLHARFEAT